MFNELPIPHSRKEYFRTYYLENKNKYIKEDNKPKKKRGRPKKVIKPFTINSGLYNISWD
tara:strand:- start:25 stop:204 length:180 start_codon:yes stop_codon:yes gene_type:complete